MKRIRLISIPLSDEEFNEVLERPDVQGLSGTEQKELIETLRENTSFNFKTALLAAMRVPLDKNGGLSIEEIERSLTIIAELKKTEIDEILELDDEDMDFMVKKLDAVRMTVFDDRWVTLRRTVKNATKDVID